MFVPWMGADRQKGAIAELAVQQRPYPIGVAAQSPDRLAATLEVQSHQCQ